MSETSIVQVVERVGFPIFVAIWFLVRLEKRLDKFVDALYALTKSHEALLQREARHETPPGGTPVEVGLEKTARSKSAVREVP